MTTNHIKALEALLKAADFEGIAGQPRYLFDMGLSRATLKTLPAIREAIEVLKLRESGQLVRVPPSQGPTVDKLRGQLQNCVNHLERAKRHSYGTQTNSYAQCIESANKTLYETLVMDSLAKVLPEPTND